eukprot:6207474-Pleurochrysis_carterae.AAC.2
MNFYYQSHYLHAKLTGPWYPLQQPNPTRDDPTAGCHQEREKPQQLVGSAQSDSPSPHETCCF